MAIDVRTKTREVVATIERPDFLEQIEELLPENVTLARFKRVAITAVRSNPDLVNADQSSLFSALLRCAQDGLMPDGRQAALVSYKGKVSYLPMIDGIRAIAAAYGWQIRTSVVYAKDEFDYIEEPPVITHRPVRPGEERGELVAAYAVGRHRDGRREQAVLHPADIAKRRAKAQTDSVWREWPEAMWMKSAGHAIFGQLGLDPSDLRVSRVLSEGVLVDPVAALYGDPKDSPATPPANSTGPNVRDARGADTAGDGATTDAAAATSTTPAAASDLGAIEDGDWQEAVEQVELSDETIEAAGEVRVPGGVHQGKTVAAVAAEDGGEQWLLTQLKRLAPGDRMRPAIETYVQGRLGETWRRYEAWKAEQA